MAFFEVPNSFHLVAVALSEGGSYKSLTYRGFSSTERPTSGYTSRDTTRQAAAAI